MKTKKHLLKLLIVLVVMPLITVSQNYIPFPDSGAVWHETYWWQPSPFFYNGIGDTYIQGDTVFNDTVYKKVYMLYRDVFCSDIIISGPAYSGGLREDSINQRVFSRWSANENEKLIYDYTLQVGDTLPAEMMWFTFDTYGIYVTNIDTIQTYDGINRRVWYLDYEEIIYPGWPQIIEGIGCTSGLFGGIEPYWEGWNELLCYSVDVEEVWRSWRDTCYVFTDSCATVGIEIKYSAGFNIRTAPNPFNTQFTLENLPENKQMELVLINFFGQVVYRKSLTGGQPQQQITINQALANGLYILKIYSDKKLLFTQKVIKQ